MDIKCTVSGLYNTESDTTLEDLKNTQEKLKKGDKIEIENLDDFTKLLQIYKETATQVGITAEQVKKCLEIFHIEYDKVYKD
jgi:hypothetical protein